ncbi:DgyrCDS13492 [Dimorphilus gyrociliatus]|uniref:procollagen-lysine 5-dioxygenase n=1 Tax=Dimorphilus gyrociliatus TaxID=2664684 RepID=A0A7I8WAT2_9ANNE|nr:DgyrCDS13492 [Dimorphilus gyrociliatus]
MKKETIFLLFVIATFISYSSCKPDADLLLVTIASERTDGFERWRRSAEHNGFTNIRVLGLGEEWRGGSMLSIGGGYKVNLLKKGLKDIKDREDLLVLFTDSYDVIFTNDKSKLLNSYSKKKCNVLFSAEDYCWPDKSLSSSYPIVSKDESRYLNSGGFIGPAKDIYSIINQADIADDDDDQLYYTKIFLNPSLRVNKLKEEGGGEERERHREGGGEECGDHTKYGLCLDTRSELFQNLHGALENVGIRFKDSSSYLYNYRTGYAPTVIHGNGPIKLKFNSLANYLSDEWTPSTGWRNWETFTNLENSRDSDLPTVLMALYFYRSSAFIEEFFDYISRIDYPKSNIFLYIHVNVDYHVQHVDEFIGKYGKSYATNIVFKPSSNLLEGHGRNKALDECLRLNCRYYFAVDSDSHLSNPKILKDLISLNKSVSAPMMTRDGKIWSNFWGGLNDQGFYARSDDYISIVTKEKQGVWNVPFISDVYLVQSSVINKKSAKYLYVKEDFDADMAFCANLRDLGIHMYVDNRESYGYLINSDKFKTDLLHGDLIVMSDNRNVWTNRYIHPKYWKALNNGEFIEEPCNDVYWIPFMTDRYCKELIERAESFGKWSGGGHQPSVDPRLGGGYENVPTVDIHMNQIDLEEQWLYFLREFVGPINNKIFTGYYTDARAHMNFIVRYKPNEQNRLKPHHDSSTFTINIALNTPGIDYEGGGTRFVRYNCNITASRKGWVIMHPGRLTHYHEGLPTTNGTRYIMVSFIDP